MSVSFQFSAGVLNLFPAAQVRFVVVHGLNNTISWPDVAKAVEELEAEVQSGAFIPYDENGPEIGSWHEAYRRFGTNPRRVRPSVDALGRRLAKNGRLPRINSAVDAYNLVSVRYGVPAGAFDLDKLDMPVDIRYGDPTRDAFTPLGEPDVTEHPGEREVVYASGHRVLTRHWNHRDCDESKVAAETRRAVFILERVTPAMSIATLVAAQRRLIEIVTPYAEHVIAACIDEETPRSDLSAGEPGLTL